MRKIKMLALSLMMLTTLSLTSCYTLTYSVGKGAQTGITVTKKNHYLINGLAPIGASNNPEQMAGDAKDYDVTITHSFVDGLLNFLTGGIYTPTTIKVTK